MSFFFLRRLSDQKVEVLRGGRLLDFFFSFLFFSGLSVSRHVMFWNRSFNQQGVQTVIRV